MTEGSERRIRTNVTRTRRVQAVTRSRGFRWTGRRFWWVIREKWTLSFVDDDVDAVTYWNAQKNVFGCIMWHCRCATIREFFNSSGSWTSCATNGNPTKASLPRDFETTAGRGRVLFKGRCLSGGTWHLPGSGWQKTYRTVVIFCVFPMQTNAKAVHGLFPRRALNSVFVTSCRTRNPRLQYYCCYARDTKRLILQ